MDFNDSAKFVPNSFKGNNIKMTQLQEKFDFVKYNDRDPFYLMRFNEVFKKDLTAKLFDLSEDSNFRLLNNTILKKISEEEYHFVGQIDEPSIFLQYTKVSKERGWIKLLEYEGSSVSVPQGHEKSPLYYYVDMAHSVYTRARGTYYCVFYHDNGIWAASQTGLFKLDKSDESTLNGYTIDALLYLFSLTSVVYGEFDRSNHFPNTFITACVRTPMDVFFNDFPKYDVTFISGHLPFPFFYIKTHTRKHFIGTEQLGDAHIQFPSKLWPVHLVDYENRAKSLDLYSQLEVYSSKFKTSMVISNEDNHIVEFLISGSMKIEHVALKLIELQQKGKLTMNQYTLTKSFTPKEILRFTSEMFKKDRLLNEILQSYYGVSSFKANPLAFKSFMYCCYQKLMNRNMNKSIVELLKGKLPEKRFNFYDVKDVNVSAPLSEESQYSIRNDSNKKFTLLKLGNKTCQIKRENFIMSCSIKETELGLYTLYPDLNTVEFEISLGEKHSSDLSNIMKNLKEQFDRSAPEYTLTTEDSTPLSPYKYQIPKDLLEKILVFLHFNKDRMYSQVDREIVDEFFGSNMLPVRSNASIRTSIGIQIEDYVLSYGQTSLKILKTFEVQTEIKESKSYTKNENLLDVPTPHALLYMIVGRRLDLLNGTENERSLSEAFQKWMKTGLFIEKLKFDKTLFFREAMEKQMSEFYTYSSSYEATYGEISMLKNIFKKA